MYRNEFDKLLGKRFTRLDQKGLQSGDVSVVGREFTFIQQEDGKMFYQDSKEIPAEDVEKIISSYDANSCIIRSSSLKGYSCVTIVFGRLNRSQPLHQGNRRTHPLFSSSAPLSDHGRNYQSLS